MIVLYVVLPLALGVAGAAVIAFMWVARTGQLDDLDTPPRRILFDDPPRQGPPPPPLAHDMHRD